MLCLAASVLSVVPHLIKPDICSPPPFLLPWSYPQIYLYILMTFATSFGGGLDSLRGRREMLNIVEHGSTNNNYLHDYRTKELDFIFLSGISVAQFCLFILPIHSSLLNILYHYQWQMRFLSVCVSVFAGLSLDHQTVSAASRIRLSEREEECLSCYLQACDTALHYLQELDKVFLF